MAVVDNTRETITEVHHSFAVLFSRLFSRHASNPERSHEKGLSNGTASNRDLLSDGKFLSEISSALASRILDWTRGAHLSAQSGAASIAALQPTGRDNRSTSVLACPKHGGASKRLMIHYPHGTTALRLSTARLAQPWLGLPRCNGEFARNLDSNASMQ